MRKNSYNYRVQRGAKGNWLVTANDTVYRVHRGIVSGTWYVTITGASLFNAGTLRDCVIWIILREGLTDAV